MPAVVPADGPIFQRIVASTPSISFHGLSRKAFVKFDAAIKSLGVCERRHSDSVVIATLALCQNGMAITLDSIGTGSANCASGSKSECSWPHCGNGRTPPRPRASHLSRCKTRAVWRGSEIDRLRRCVDLKQRGRLPNDPKENGRGEWIRTTDPSVPNRVLYQAEPRPDNPPILSQPVRRAIGWTDPTNEPRAAIASRRSSPGLPRPPGRVLSLSPWCRT